MRRWICAATALLLAGCSTIPSVPTHVQMERETIRASGGSFVATYSGNYAIRDCGGAIGTFHFNGSGSGSFIHGSKESGTMSSGDKGCQWFGNATLTSSSHPRNSITMRLSLLNFGNGNTPCHPRFGAKVKFIVGGGTGRFINAAGNGTVVFMCHSDGTYSDQWSGTITY